MCHNAGSHDPVKYSIFQNGFSDCVLLCSQRNKRKKWIYMQVFLMRRPLCFLWPWLRSTVRSWAKDSFYRLLPEKHREPIIGKLSNSQRMTKEGRSGWS